MTNATARLLAIAAGALLVSATGCTDLQPPTIVADGVWYGRVNDPFAPPVDGLELTLTTMGSTISGSGRRYVGEAEERGTISGTQSAASLRFTLRFPQFAATGVAYIHDAHHMTCNLDYGDNGAPETFEMLRD